MNRNNAPVFNQLTEQRKARLFALADTARVQDPLPLVAYFGGDAPNCAAYVASLNLQPRTMISEFWEQVQAHPLLLAFVLEGRA